jgi:hypothetical protein
VTTELLRLVSPAAIASEALRLLRREEHQSLWGQQLGGQSIPPDLQHAYERLLRLSTVATGTSESELQRIAERYCVLCARGLPRPLPQLAAEFGVTRDQARDRVRRARELHYIAPCLERVKPLLKIGPRSEQHRSGDAPGALVGPARTNGTEAVEALSLAATENPPFAAGS